MKRFIIFFLVSFSWAVLINFPFRPLLSKKQVLKDLNPEFKKLNLEIKGFKSKELDVAPGVFGELKTRNLRVRSYKKKGLPEIILYLVYEEGPASFHPPEYCYIGIGEEEISSRKKRTLKIGKEVLIYNIVQFRSHLTFNRYAVIYWFMSKNIVTSNYYLQRIFRIFSSLGFLERDWTMVRLTLLLDDFKLEEVIKNLEPFLANIYLKVKELWTDSKG